MPEPTELLSLPCQACVDADVGCCEDIQVFLTRGDVRRMSRHLGRDGFAAEEKLLPYYLNDRGDPEWRRLTTLPDGRRRVLRRDDHHRCVLLGPTGCILPEDVRPLLCRIYPYDFTRQGLTGLCDDCPVAFRADHEAALKRMGMELEKVKTWQEILYEEIDAELAERAGQ